MSQSEAKYPAGEFLSALFLYARDFNYNHLIFEVNRFKVSVNLARRSNTYGNADLFYVSADPKSFAPVLSAVNQAIEIAELEGDRQAKVKTPDLDREEQIFQFKLKEFGHGRYQLDLSV
ncbi:hypothetical protein [Fructobacillus ficulneus]|uniref:Uncharacterized protein n=1 Tax=Fructobacillus ficulneus TaxID=157463 RepID=A0A0K8MGS3_9LACO|nr:hypothetical protein [Fructobacillus ficulneus]GAO99735.1 hypothetical protein FFIC_240080 [Fructobacillus ficulneus]